MAEIVSKADLEDALERQALRLTLRIVAATGSIVIVSVVALGAFLRISGIH